MHNIFLKKLLVIIVFFIISGCERHFKLKLDPNITINSSGFKTIQHGILSPDANLLFGTSLTATYLWDLTDGKLLKVFKNCSGFNYANRKGIIFNPTRDQIAIQLLAEVITCNIKTGEVLNTFEHADTGAMDDMAFNSTGSILATFAHDFFDSEESNVYLWNVDTGKRLKIFKKSKPLAYLNSLDFSPTDPKILAITSCTSYACATEVYNIDTGTLLRTFDTMSNIKFSPNGKILAGLGTGQTLQLWDVDNGALLKTLSAGDSLNGIERFSFSPNSKIIVSEVDGSVDDPHAYNIFVWDVDSGKLLNSILDQSNIYSSISFGASNNVFSSIHNDSIRLWDLKSTKPILSFRSFRHGDIWDNSFSSISYTPDGYYTVSDNVKESVIADKNKNRPDIVESRLRGIASPQSTIKTASVTQPTPKTDLQKTIPKPTNISPFPPEFEYEPQYDLPTNCQLPTEQNLINDKRPRLFIMAVGINDYPTLSKGEQLNYPSEDAEAIVSTFKKMEGRLFSKVHTCLLTSNSKTKPTADRLRDSLRFIRMAGQYDVAILYMAGHAIRNSADKYYFLGSNAKFDKQGFVYPSTVLPWTDIMDTLKQPATTLAFIDTCHSGALIGKKSRSINYNDASKLLTQGGTAVLTAASNNESAFEGGGGLTHGYFTHAILQGLEQLKADNNQDGIVTLDELDRYVSSTVSRMSSGQQHPVSLYPETGFDKDIPLWQ